MDDGRGTRQDGRERTELPARGRPRFIFERLHVYQEAKSLALDLMKLSRQWPKDVQFTLTPQVQRAAVSVASNLAEGSSRLSARDQAHFTSIAYSSLMEVVCQVDLAQGMGWVTLEEGSALAIRAQGLARQLSALHRAQQKRRKGQP